MSARAPALDVGSTAFARRSATFLLLRARDYFALTRPRILLLVLLTVPPALGLGAEGPSRAVVMSVLAGVAFLGAGSSALNAWWERERDARMARTAGRPLPEGRIAPLEALIFGVVISVAGLALLLAMAHPLAALLGVMTLAHYLFVYTLWLKPRSAWSTVVGAFAGAAPPLLADAVDGSIGGMGLLLFAIVLLWQPPHVWAIASYRADDYAAGGFPMLPAVAGRRVARRWSLAFAIALLGTTLIPVFTGSVGLFYGSVAFVAGAFFVERIARAMRLDTREADRDVFKASLGQLSLVLAAMLVELLVR
jgi:protoheme IX farnesyltransferase